MAKKFKKYVAWVTTRALPKSVHFQSHFNVLPSNTDENKDKITTESDKHISLLRG
jgi:hypothetical protein